MTPDAAGMATSARSASMRKRASPHKTISKALPTPVAMPDKTPTAAESPAIAEANVPHAISAAAIKGRFLRFDRSRKRKKNPKTKRQSATDAADASHDISALMPTPESIGVKSRRFERTVDPRPDKPNAQMTKLNRIPDFQHDVRKTRHSPSFATIAIMPHFPRCFAHLFQVKSQRPHFSAMLSQSIRTRIKQEADRVPLEKTHGGGLVSPPPINKAASM